MASELRALYLSYGRENLCKLISWFAGFNSALVALSGGVDSGVLAFAARSALNEKAFAVTSVSESFASSELIDAKQLAKEIGIDLSIVSQDDLQTESYTANGPNRCYFCRMNLVQAMRPILESRQPEVCVDGTHVDDMGTPRPGVKALREAGFRAPYVELGIGKEDIRIIARSLNLSSSEKPSEACLSSRIAYGQKIDANTLRRIEVSERMVRDITKARIVRVRTIGTRAVVEVDRESIPNAMKNIEVISSSLEDLGYSSVEINENGYLSGRMLSLFVKGEQEESKSEGSREVHKSASKTSVD